ncbi:MAG: triose-phosphate isomerase [Peptoniphilaceae bacterium]|nr:triose-phosphate isomerase [Peptoniphilaceae bacterium]MDY6018412.1 triose-phosphate isomerase [Anaerococcus sp.]
MRKPVIVGNWKMNLGPKEAKNLLTEVKALDLDNSVEYGFCVPSIDLLVAKEVLEGTNINYGAENMYFEESGAFTGEISPAMLTEVKATYVIIGHSERRQYFKEDNELINKKVISALEHGLTPILCVGETLEEREANKEEEVVKEEVVKGFEGIKEADKVIIAYEPIWAIGTGKTASAEDADSMCAYIRKLIEELYGKESAEKIRIQYGGSMKPSNVKELLAKENIDGGLIGGASLKASDFEQLVNFKK